MSEFGVERPADRSASGLADWIEALMIVERASRLSRTAVKRRLRGLAGGNGDLEFEVDLLLAEVAERRRIAPAVYPFEPSGRGGVSRVATVSPTIYIFLLWLSAPFSPVRVESRYGETDRWLDLLVLNVLLAYLGPTSVGVRFGFPASDDRPTSFPDAIRWLAEKLGLSEGVGTPSPEVKDGGVDVIAWKPFADKRSGFLVILAQVTAEEGWRSKFGNVLLKRWEGWVDFGADPMTALAVPFALSWDWERWDDLRRATTLLLDRFRLAEYVDPSRVADASAIADWVDAESKKMLL
jgi:hypothetical protein